MLFESAGKLIWDPSPRVASMFQHHVRALEEMLAIRSGVGEVANDECEIDEVQLRLFLQVVAAEIERTSNPILVNLVGGCFAIAAGLLHVCDPDQALMLQGTSAVLQRHGIDMIAGRENVGALPFASAAGS